MLVCIYMDLKLAAGALSTRGDCDLGPRDRARDASSLIADGARLERGHTLSCGWIEAWRRESSVSTGSGSLGVDWGRNGHTVCSHRAVTHFRDISRKAGRNRPPCAMVSESPRFFWLCAHIIISVHLAMVSDRSDRRQKSLSKRRMRYFLRYDIFYVMMAPALRAGAIMRIFGPFCTCIKLNLWLAGIYGSRAEHT